MSTAQQMFAAWKYITTFTGRNLPKLNLSVTSLCRLYKEALKQAAVDPSTGKIDISILTTGISGAARKRKAEVASALKNLIHEKGKIPTLKYQKLYEEFREKSDFVSTFVFALADWKK